MPTVLVIRNDSSCQALILQQIRLAEGRSPETVLPARVVGPSQTASNMLVNATGISFSFMSPCHFIFGYCDFTVVSAIIWSEDSVVYHDEECGVSRPKTELATTTMRVLSKDAAEEA